MLYDQLRESWPCEVVEPFGEVLVIPNRLFKPQWKAMLESEGVRIYSQAYNGETCFFLKEGNAKPIQRKPKRRWTTQDDALLKDLYSQGLAVRDIGSKLDRSRLAVQHRLQRLGLLTPSQPINKDVASEPSSLNDSVVKEFLACVSELYPRYPSVCKLLLQEASNKINI